MAKLLLRAFLRPSSSSFPHMLVYEHKLRNGNGTVTLDSNRKHGAAFGSDEMVHSLETGGWYYCRLGYVRCV